MNCIEDHSLVNQLTSLKVVIILVIPSDIFKIFYTNISWLGKTGVKIAYPFKQSNQYNKISPET